MNLWSIFQAQARRRPTATALTFEGQAVSYAWLAARSSEFARRLAAHGLRAGDVAAVLMQRSPDMVAALLAVIQLGAAYLPLDPEYPEARLEMILADAGASVVLTETAQAGRLDLDRFPRLAIAETPADEAALGRPEILPGDLAYVLYTSGSTGRPKGVEISHGAVLNLLSSFQRALAFGEDDAMLAATTLSFDISVLEIFLPLSVGGRIVLGSSAAVRDPQVMSALLDESGCTFAQATPSKWRYVIESGWAGRKGLKLVCGGEALTRDLADRLLARADALWNVYGPTETTVWSTLGRVQPETEPPSIGWPIDATTLHVLDEAGDATPQGEIGELYIGGAGLARGYRSRPELTRERFIFRKGERLYRTGDLVRRRADGALDCLGRIDHQVKIRGFRIELGDVEAALCQCEGIAWAAAGVFTDETGQHALAAYVTPLADAQPDPVALRRDLATRLPDYMLPARFVRLDTMPMTSNGKIDRNALPPPDRTLALIGGSPGEMTPIEARLAKVWTDVLGVGEVRAQDNFFDLGGYSLLTLTLLRRIETEFGRTLSIADLFACADLGAMAVLLDRDEPALAPTSRYIPLQPLGSRPPLIWFDVGPQLRRLATTLAPDQPFIGLNLEPHEERELAGSRVTGAAIAQYLVRALRTYQPAGPYRLGGWCRWGVMAHAAASQLMREGETVELLVLLDAVNMASPYQSLRRVTRGARRGVQALTGRTRGVDTQPPQTTFNFGEQVLDASLRYRPAAYHGPVLLLRACDAEPDWDGASGWRDSVKGPLTIVDLDGDHAGILTPPYVESLGRAVRAGLNQAQLTPR